MANGTGTKGITRTAPTPTSVGARIVLQRTAAGVIAVCEYDPGDGLPVDHAPYSEAEVAGNGPVAAAVTTLFNVAFAAGVAPTRMGF